MDANVLPIPPRTDLNLSAIEQFAVAYQVPLADVLLIGLNLYGISSTQDRHRARVSIQLESDPDHSWMIIVPLNAADSPFRLVDTQLMLGADPIGDATRIDADEAVGGYFRNGGRAATLNPNARSRCVGCAFCPNTLEAAADPRLAEERGLTELLSALVEQHPRNDLTELDEVTVSTGCFERELPAVEYMAKLRKVLREYDVDARIGFLTSVVRSDEAFARLQTETEPFILRLTSECFSRRDLLLKASKAELTPKEMPDVLRRAAAAGLDTSFTYIVGLDSIDEMRIGMEQLIPHINEFPNLQVYQAHNSIMAGLRDRGADTIEYYLRARIELERLLEPGGLRPVAWECYRPLWYTTFAGERLTGA